MSLLAAFTFYISVAPMVWVLLAAKVLVAVPASNPLPCTWRTRVFHQPLARWTERGSFCSGFQKTISETLTVAAAAGTTLPKTTQDIFLAEEIGSLHKRPPLLEGLVLYAGIEFWKPQFCAALVNKKPRTPIYTSKSTKD